MQVGGVLRDWILATVRRKAAVTTLPDPALFCEAVVKEIAVMTLVISGA
jgi:hypothetical protein